MESCMAPCRMSLSSPQLFGGDQVLEVLIGALFSGRPLSAEAEDAYLSLAALATAALELPAGVSYPGRRGPPPSTVDLNTQL